MSFGIAMPCGLITGRSSICELANPKDDHQRTRRTARHLYIII